MFACNVLIIAAAINCCLQLDLQSNGAFGERLPPSTTTMRRQSLYRPHKRKQRESLEHGGQQQDRRQLIHSSGVHFRYHCPQGYVLPWVLKIFSCLSFAGFKALDKRKPRFHRFLIAHIMTPFPKNFTKQDVLPEWPTPS